MKKMIFKKTLYGCVSLSMALSLISPSAMMIAAEDEGKTKAVADIYPKPQIETYQSEEGMKLSGEVNVVFHGDQDEATLPHLKQILEENKIAYAITDAADETKANIIVSSSKTHCSECEKVESSALAEKEGYVLQSSDDENEKGTILIVGSDIDGAYYGVMTLKQMLQQKNADGNIAEVTIEDYPEIGFRGFIEGFYGYPWTHEERMSLMQDTSMYKMNTYIYAPKDDPYHRLNWKELYPEDEAAQIAELAQAGHENNFNFCWTIHPGASLNFSEADFDALIKKYQQLYDLGVRQFGVLFDDTDDWYNGTKQAAFINRIDTEFVKAKGDVKPMIVVAARYNAGWGPGVNYFKSYMQDLHEDIQIMWTGAATMSNISKEVFEYPKNWTNVDRDVAVWWNYPVNDYCDQRLVMAPLHNLSPNLDNVTAFFSNPMQQADASKVALYSIADYSWNTDAYDYQWSWERSIEELVPEASDAFKNFAEDTSYLKDDGGSSGPFVYNESWNSVDKIEALNEAMRTGVALDEAANAMLAKYQQMSTDAATLRGIQNANLLEEITLHLASYKSLGEAGQNAIQALLAANKGELGNWLAYNNAAKDALAEMDKNILISKESDGTKENIVAVGEQYLKPEVTAILNAASNKINKTVFVTKDLEVTDSKGLLEAELSDDQGIYTVKNAVSTENEMIVAIPKASQVSAVTLKTNQNDAVKVQTSLNGIDWTDAEVSVDGDALKITEQTALTFIKVNAVDALTITSLVVEPVYKANPTISQNIGEYENYYIGKAMDGNMNTKFWSDKAVGTGHYVQVDLGKVIPLYDVTAYFDPNDCFVNGDMEVSADGFTWTKAATLTYSTENGKKVFRNNSEGQRLRYFRFIAKASQKNWLQIYEIDINKAAVTGDDIVTLIDTNMKGSATNVYDQELSTSFKVEDFGGDEKGYLNYMMTRITNVKDIQVLQEQTAISNGEVWVTLADGTKEQVGVLDENVSVINVNKTIKEINLVFTADQPMPEIYEIVVSEFEKAPIVKDVLKAAILKANDLEAEEYTTASWSALQAKLDVANTVMNNESAEQAEVDETATALEEAIAALDKKAGASLIDSLKKAVQSLVAVEDRYTEEEFAAARLAMEKANEILQKAEDEIGVSEVHASIMEIMTAKDKLTHNVMLDALKILRKQAVMILSSDEIDTVRPAKVRALRDAVKEAQALIDEESTDLEAIAAIQNNLYKAIHELYQIVDKNMLKELAASARALDEEKYTSDTWNAMIKEVEAAEYIVHDQDATVEAVEQSYDALTRAIIELKIKTDKSALQEQLALANEVQRLAKNYVPSTIIGLSDVIKEAQIVYDNKEATQAEINAATNQLVTALANARLKADKSGLESAVAQARAKNLALYTSASGAKLEAALKEAEKVLANEAATKAEVKAAINAVQAATKGLVKVNGNAGSVKNPGNKQNPSVNTGVEDNRVALAFLFMMTGAAIVCFRKKETE